MQGLTGAYAKESPILIVVRLGVGRIPNVLGKKRDNADHFTKPQGASCYVLICCGMARLASALARMALMFVPRKMQN